MPHRHDIQGLRAVAVLLVALDHAGVPFLRGGYVGVDVFFVLSGFLITGLLLSQAATEGRISLGDFYLRRARRILPAAALTLVATDIAAHHLLNFVRAREAVSDSIWASLFAANTHFASQGSDYFAQGQPPSPLLHFWSLSVEEQFYVVWPSVVCLVLLGTLFARRRLLIVAVAAGAASFVWALHTTSTSPTAAYFSTPARAWELALGATLAIAASRLRRVPAGAQAVMGWTGLVAIGFAAVMFSSSTHFPGYAALLPTLGAALVIAAQPGLGVGRLLSLRPLRFVGDRSYAFYLWHWPVLVLAVQHAGHPLSLGTRLALLCGAFLLSIVSYAVFENPLRRMRWPGRVGALSWPASAAVVLVLAFVILGSIGNTAHRIEAASAAVRPAGLVDRSLVKAPPSRPLPPVVAAVRAAQRGDPIPSPLTPPVSRLRDDFYRFPGGCIPGDGQTSSRICRLGDTASPKTIAVLGDSHAEMWMPTILRMARRDRWVVVPFVKVRCIPRTWLESRGECASWYRWATGRASALRPDVTLIVGSSANTWAPQRAVRATALLVARMKRSSMSVIVVGDVTGQSREPTDCLLDSHSTMRTCSTAMTATQVRVYGAIAAAARHNGAGYVDTRGWFCATPRGSSRPLCPLVVNQTITAVDRGHVSKTYALELLQPFRTAFRAALFG